MVDLRQHCSPVENQRGSNSCTANSVAGAYEYLNVRYCEETGDTPGDISRLFIYYVGRKSDQLRFKEEEADQKPKDKGMTISGAINTLTKKGACLEKDWPFELSAVNECPKDECFAAALDYKIRDSVRVPVNEHAMKACLAEGYPLIFGLRLTKRFFQTDAAGAVETPDAGDAQATRHGLHCMLAVGYNDAQRRFIVRNSWGEHWGHHGYCFIPYDYMCDPKANCCHQYAIRSLATEDLTPAPPPLLEYSGDVAIRVQQADGDVRPVPLLEFRLSTLAGLRAEGHDARGSFLLRGELSLGNTRLLATKRYYGRREYDRWDLRLAGAEPDGRRTYGGHWAPGDAPGENAGAVELVLLHTPRLTYAGPAEGKFEVVDEGWKEMAFSAFELSTARGLSAAGEDANGAFELTGQVEGNLKRLKVRAQKLYTGKKRPIYWDLEVQRPAPGAGGPVRLVGTYTLQEGWPPNGDVEVALAGEFVEDEGAAAAAALAALPPPPPPDEKRQRAYFEDDEVQEVEEEDEPDEPEGEGGFDARDAFDGEAEARRCFASVDADGSGTVEKQELATALRRLGVLTAGAGAVEVVTTVNSLFAKYDADGDGRLDFEEFKGLAAELELTRARRP